MNRVLFIFTGGTISMRFDPATGGAVPALSGREILAFDPELERMTSAEVIDFGRYPGPHMNPARMWELSELLARELAREDIRGAVVTHGTDTLEETAYFLDLRHLSPKPVAVVGALRNSSELSYDGPANLRAAARVAMDPQAQGQGVFVVLNQTIHAASEATKTDTQQLETFQSPVFGPLGIVDADHVLFTRSLRRRMVLDTPAYEPRVELFQMYAGADGRALDHAVADGARGIVIEGTGRGNVPPEALPAVARAIGAEVAVVIASRCAHGRVLDTYAYAGSGRDLRRLGVLFAGTLSGAKARIKLMLALGRTSDPALLRSLIEAGSY
jgi:L-asparaginase